MVWNFPTPASADGMGSDIASLAASKPVVEPDNPTRTPVRETSRK